MESSSPLTVRDDLSSFHSVVRMNNQFDQKPFLTAASVVISIAIGFFLSGSKDGMALNRLQKEEERNNENAAILKIREDHVEAREKAVEAKLEEVASKLAALETRENVVTEREEKLEALASSLGSREGDVANKEAALNDREAVMWAKEADLDNRRSIVAAAEETARRREAGVGTKTEQTSAVERQSVGMVQKNEEQNPPALNEAATVETLDDDTVDVETEKERRTRTIREGLTKIVQLTESEELGEEIEPEAVVALEKAAMVLCLRKKYYDVMKDELIYFPTVNKAVFSGDLIEEAEKFYYDEEDEFPLVYSAALRSIATSIMSEEELDLDEDYMRMLALDVEI